MNKLIGTLLGVVVAAGTLTVSAPAASMVEAATCASNFPWASEQEFADYEGGPGFDCERNFVTTAPRGELLDPNSIGANGLLRPDRVSFFESVGFTKNFMWYAPRTTTIVSPADSRTWTACTVGVTTGGICPSLKVGPMSADFDGTFELSIIGSDATFIALVCGNYSSADPTDFTTTPYANPVPRIDGVKYRDDNRNGVRNAGEPTLAGWNIRVTRLSSRIEQPTGTVANLTTDSNGYYRFNLDGHGPGRYLVEEIPQPGWKNYTPASYTVDVDFGVESRRYGQDFGNAPTTADVAKTDMTIVSDLPENLDANTPVDVDVSVTIENFGPAEQVPVRDELIATLPADCVTRNGDRRSFTTTLRRGQPVTRTFTFTIECARPSNHDFDFDDRLTIIHPDIVDTNPMNNAANVGFERPVHAYTDLGIGATLACDATTDVGDTFGCRSTLVVTNDGFGDIDATATAELTVPDDCTVTSRPGAVKLNGLGEQGRTTSIVSFGVVCSHRSDHPITLTAEVTADDIHVFDTDPTNNTSSPAAVNTEVFHDATLAADAVHLTCNESIGTGDSFTCTATVGASKTGPAPDVDVIAYAALGLSPQCTAVEGRHQETEFVLSSSTVVVFTWTVTCPSGESLHPFNVVTDVNPNPETEPHAVDQPGPIIDTFAVPTCRPTVNPHGKTKPAAPGNGGQGQNQDGFYEFGTLPLDQNLAVSIRDDGSGVVFGPFPSGTKIKWVEANGATPSITPMGGNNGNGNGQAAAVDYQIRAQGDAVAFVVDERGIETSVTCLVPPRPQ